MTEHRPAAAPPLYPERVMPPAKPLRLPTFLATFIRNPLAALPETVYRDWIHVFEAGRATIAWITGPTLVKTVLLDEREWFVKTPVERRVLGPLLGSGVLTAEGPEWRWQRQIVAPLFRHQDLVSYVPQMVAAAEACLAGWSRPDGRETVENIERAMARATFQVISATMLPEGEAYARSAIERAHEHFLKPITWQIAYGIMRLPGWLPHPGLTALRRAERELRESVTAIVRARRTSTLAHDDLLERLLKARSPETGEPMTEAQLVDNLLTFLLAGHATTALALTWTLHLVASSPTWDAAIRREIAEVVGAGPVRADHIDRLEVVTRVVKESMRLFPPVPVVTRIAARDFDLGGRRLKAGTLIVLPIYAIHRHRRLWDDPDRFDPDRFLPEAEAARPRYYYMPFGAGPRICIGMSFAMIEAVTILATLLPRVRLSLIPGDRPEPVSRITLRPHKGLRLRVRPIAPGADT